MTLKNRTLAEVLKRGNLLPRVINKISTSVSYMTSYIGFFIARSPSPVAVLYGKNDDEENLLSMALTLSGLYNGQVVILVADRKRVQSYLQTISNAFPDSDLSRIDLIEKSDKSIRHFHLNSRIVITSHVIFSSRLAPQNRVHVHVTHGLGPKTYRNPHSSEMAIASNSAIWNGAHLKAMHKPRNAKVLTGMPREDLLGHKPQNAEHSLKKLGIDPSLPFVVWVPTFRTTIVRGSEVWSEGAPLTSVIRSGAANVAQMKAAAHKEGVQLVVKPHPIEATAFNQLGLSVVTSQQVWDSGLSVYQFLGLSNGLISDYSSIWIDYLAARRPIGLYCPDIEYFENGPRGLLGPSYSEIIDPLMLTTADHFSLFFNSVATATDFHRIERENVAKKIGYVFSDQYKAKKLGSEILELGVTAGMKDVFINKTTSS